MAQYSGDISMPIKLRFKSLAALAVVPDPRKGSNITPPH